MESTKLPPSGNLGFTGSVPSLHLQPQLLLLILRHPHQPLRFLQHTMRPLDSGPFLHLLSSAWNVLWILCSYLNLLSRQFLVILSPSAYFPPQHYLFPGFIICLMVYLLSVYLLDFTVNSIKAETLNVLFNTVFLIPKTGNQEVPVCILNRCSTNIY